MTDEEESRLGNIDNLIKSMKKELKSSIEFLKKREWSMGNGQCPECCGVPESWHGNPCYLTTENIGHELNCKLAESLKELGETPLIKGDFVSEIEYESYITDNGFFSTRKKTAEGCHKYKKFIDKTVEAINNEKTN
jgi:hypothetical protein